MAAALLLAVTLYQSIIVIPTLRQDLSEATTAQALPTVIARQATRGDDDVIRIAPTDRFVHLVLDVLGPAGSLYVCDIRDEAGNILFRVPATKSSESGSLGLLLPTAALKSGRHEVTVRATDSAESPLSGPGENYTFVLERN